MPPSITLADLRHGTRRRTVGPPSQTAEFARRLMQGGHHPLSVLPRQYVSSAGKVGLHPSVWALEYVFRGSRVNPTSNSLAVISSWASTIPL